MLYNIPIFRYFCAYNNSTYFPVTFTLTQWLIECCSFH
ncbi:hypothetical protein LEP1GSC199_0009 [Leptospira vanthielii serovar Holland str. Waz Holland = ATCC 700522]|uniref:Uncharacterized protein n=1 Tax=Leptospira vanthielii serovar Holland str. Waz Holland = ATCC 700522 TaxID=1218591 RepID=N1W3S8_9LEPT|nr:hypothetical protein LEP1GSC199_0009 [Leptospira vanthielii serovar Holland str. Waz Holland = ATCC 700522]